MSKPFRQSILMRPVKDENTKNRENVDYEYQKEQERLAALARKKQELEEERLKSIYPTSDTKISRSQQLREEMERQLREKEALAARQAEYERTHASTVKSHVQLTQYVEQDHDQARREYQRYLMEENKRLIELREQQRKAELAREKAPQEDFFGKHWGKSGR